VKGLEDVEIFYNFTCRELFKKAPKTEFLIHSFIAFFISILNFEIEPEMEPMEGHILWNNRGILLTLSLYMFIVRVMIFPVQIARIHFHDSCR
jgi:hypothetical protein